MHVAQAMHSDHSRLREEVSDLKSTLEELEQSHEIVLDCLSQAALDVAINALTDEITARLELQDVLHESPSSTRRPTISCIAVGHSSIPTEEVNALSAVKEEVEGSDEPTWPLSNITPVVTASEVQLASSYKLLHTDKHISIKRQDSCTLPPGRRGSQRRTHGHVKQSASCGAMPAFYGQFEKPRLAPGIPAVVKTYDDATSSDHNLLSFSRPFRERFKFRKRSKTVGSTACQDSPSITRSTSLSAVKATAKSKVQRSSGNNEKCSLRVSMAKELPIPKELQEATSTDVIDLEQLLHDLTIANEQALLKRSMLLAS